jgi:hypothetical protein
MDKGILLDLYLKQKLSSAEIARVFKCSASRIDYWLRKYEIQKRSISDAVYQRNNPHGDPFSMKRISSPEDAFLQGLGIGLYWGEGNKKSLHSVRLGNSDPDLIRKFVIFLVHIYGIDVRKLRFGLQLFNDSDPEHAIRYWSGQLDVPRERFHKVTISKVRGEGTYKTKSQHGVLTVHFNNKRLRDLIMDSIEKLRDP